MDWQGSVPMDQELTDLMKAAGVQVERFRKPTWYDLPRLNNRTHRKLLVVDGRVGFTGGVGISDKWLGDARHPGEWRENHYRVEGPAVAQMQAAFLDNWLEASGTLLHGPAYYPPLKPVGDALAQVVRSSPHGGGDSMHLLFMFAIAAAERSIRLGTSYFVPDDLAIAHLIDARERGVEIDILVPNEHIDKEFVRRASRRFWGDLLAAGVRIHEFQPTMYHVKVLIVDDHWVSIGSANFDERSFRLNDEVNLIVLDSVVAAEEAARFDADLAVARPVSLDSWRNRPWQTRVLDWAWSTLRPQL
jgi:cardiolipin synthase A/B